MKTYHIIINLVDNKYAWANHYHLRFMVMAFTTEHQGFISFWKETLYFS